MWQVSGNNGSVLLIRATVRQSGTVPLHHDLAFRELAISVLRKPNVIRPGPTLHRNQEAQRSGVDMFSGIGFTTFKAQQPTLTCLANSSVHFIVHVEFIADPTDEAISVNPYRYMISISSPEV